MSRAPGLSGERPSWERPIDVVQRPVTASSKLAFLDGLRGLAALYVMLGHVRALLWEGHSTGYLLHPHHYNLAGRAIVYGSALFRWGHEAVIFFFVLSGFVIHLKYARHIQGEGPGAAFDLGNYLHRRARRLYPPLLLALLLTFVLDMVGRYLGLAIHFGTTHYPRINTTVGSDHQVITLLKNLVFVMQPVFGSNGPLWSLNYEWYFYLLYPLVFLLARRSRLIATAAVAALSMGSFIPLWPKSAEWIASVLRLMIVWWFGSLLADRFAGRFSVQYSSLSLLNLAWLVVPFAPANGIREMVIGLGFTGVLAVLLALQQDGRSLAVLEYLRPLGAMSYTLYVIHFPILALMSGLVMRANGGLLPEHFGWAAAGAVISLIAAWALHFVVERPFTAGPSHRSRV